MCRYNRATNSGLLADFTVVVLRRCEFGLITNIPKKSRTPRCGALPHARCKKGHVGGASFRCSVGPPGPKCEVIVEKSGVRRKFPLVATAPCAPERVQNLQSRRHIESSALILGAMYDECLDPELDALIRTGEAYLEMSFGFRLNLEAVHEGQILSDIRGAYEVFRGGFHDKSVTAVYYRGREIDVVDDFVRNRERFDGKVKSDIVLLLTGGVTGITRRRLIEQRVGFLVPGSQLYIPEMFLDLRDRVAHIDVRPKDRISPLAQLIILGTLLGERLEGANLTELAERFRVSVMSSSRVMSELEALGVAKAKFVGRERCLHLPVRDRLLWESVKDRLRSPVRKIRSVKGDLPDDVMRLSGGAALAFYTGYDGPGVRRYAISESIFNRLEKNSFIEPADFLDEDRVEIEAWIYDPGLYSKEGVVDPLSLYLSCRYEKGGGVEGAVDKLLDNMVW